MTVDLAELKDAPVLVAGAGVSGRAAAAALVEVGARVLAAKIQKIPVAFADPHSCSLQEGAVRQG